MICVATTLIWRHCNVMIVLAHQVVAKLVTWYCRLTNPEVWQPTPSTTWCLSLRPWCRSCLSARNPGALAWAYRPLTTAPSCTSGWTSSGTGSSCSTPWWYPTSLGDGPSWIEPYSRYVVMTSWWCHGIETPSALLALCEGNPPVTWGFPSQRDSSACFDIYLNKRLKITSSCQWFETLWCPLWRYCNPSRCTEVHA